MFGINERQSSLNESVRSCELKGDNYPVEIRGRWLGKQFAAYIVATSSDTAQVPTLACYISS